MGNVSTAFSILLLSLIGILLLSLIGVWDAAAQSNRGVRPGQGRMPDRLQEGDPAPDFKLRSLDGKVMIELSSLRGKKPVALVFGSYT